MLQSSTSNTRHVTPCEGAGWASVGGRTRGKLCLGEVSNQPEMRRRFLCGCIQKSHHSSKSQVLEALNSEIGGLVFICRQHNFIYIKILSVIKITDFYLYSPTSGIRSTGDSSVG